MLREVIADVRMPSKLKFLDEPARYKVIHGGRGSSKSWSVARALLVAGTKAKRFIVCGREFQKSTEDSVHRLLDNQIGELGLRHFYEVQKTRIIGRNGTEFVFHGLRHNVDNIKSLEGCDICWVEEAHNVSKSSWDKLIPTVRKDGSEIWVTFNPELDDDDTYQRFVINPPASAKIEQVNWRDNPWFPDVLKQEMADLRAKDEDDYLHVYEGRTKQALEGAIFKEELRKARLENRIGHFPYDERYPVDLFIDLGWSDCNSILAIQWIGNEARAPWAHQDRLKKTQHYIKVIKDQGFDIRKIYLPHDAVNENLISDYNNDRLYQASFGSSRVQVVPRASSKTEGINEVRTVFGQMTFNQAGCADFISAIGRYRYAFDGDTGKWGREPDHDENSHYGDALRGFGRVTRGPLKKAAAINYPKLANVA